MNKKSLPCHAIMPEGGWNPSALLIAIVAMATIAMADIAPVGAQGIEQPTGTPTTGTQELEQIVVTAQYRNQSLQDTPIAITAITGYMLESRAQTRVTEIAAQAPSVTIQPAAAALGPAAIVSIRGVGQTDSNLGFEPGVGIYIDDVYFSTVFGSLIDLVDVDRVEILRGPQGTLAGKNSVGGAIKLFSVKPDDTQNNAYVQASAGSYDLVGIKAATNITLVPGSLFARVSGSGRHTQGYVQQVDFGCANPTSGIPRMDNGAGSGCVLGREGGADEVAARGQLRWIGIDKLEVLLSADVSNFDGDPIPNNLVRARANGTVINGVPYGPTFQSPNFHTDYSTFNIPSVSYFPPRKTTLKLWGVSSRVSYEFSDYLALTSITAFRRVNGYGVTDQDGSLFEGITYTTQTEQRQFTQELRLNIDVAGRAALTVGGFYYDSVGFQRGRVFFGSPIFDFAQNDRTDSDNISAFAHAVVHIGQRMNVTGGLRYTKEKKNFMFGRTPEDLPFSPLINPIDNLRGSFDKSRIDYRAVIDYRWTDQLFSYAQFSTGFKGGGVNPKPFFPNQVASFNPETITAYEIGLKSDLFDKHVRLNVAAFLNNYEDLQVLTLTPYFNPGLPAQPDPTQPNYNPIGGTFPASVFQNAGRARIDGIEGELSFRASSGTQIDLSASYLNFKYRELTPGAIASGVSLGMTSPLTPKWKGSVGVQHSFDYRACKLTPRIDYSYQSKTYSATVNDELNVLQSRGITNARLTFDFPDQVWQAAVSVTNLTDRQYYLNKFDLYLTAGYVTGLPARPREWSASLRRKF